MEGQKNYKSKIQENEKKRIYKSDLHGSRAWRNDSLELLARRGNRRTNGMEQKGREEEFGKKWTNKDRKLYIQDILFVLPWLSDRNISWYIFYRLIYKN